MALGAALSVLRHPSLAPSGGVSTRALGGEGAVTQQGGESPATDATQAKRVKAPPSYPNAGARAATGEHAAALAASASAFAKFASARVAGTATEAPSPPSASAQASIDPPREPAPSASPPTPDTAEEVMNLSGVAAQVLIPEAPREPVPSASPLTPDTAEEVINLSGVAAQVLIPEAPKDELRSPAPTSHPVPSETSPAPLSTPPTVPTSGGAAFLAGGMASSHSGATADPSPWDARQAFPHAPTPPTEEGAQQAEPSQGTTAPIPQPEASFSAVSAQGIQSPAPVTQVTPGQVAAGGPTGAAPSAPPPDVAAGSAGACAVKRKLLTITVHLPDGSKWNYEYSEDSHPLIRDAVYWAYQNLLMSMGEEPDSSGAKGVRCSAQLFDF